VHFRSVLLGADYIGANTRIARLPTQDLMSWTSVVINGQSRWGLRTLPNRREGTAMAMALLTRQPTKWCIR
jgi:hypothetical protein